MKKLVTTLVVVAVLLTAGEVWLVASAVRAMGHIFDVAIEASEAMERDQMVSAVRDAQRPAIVEEAPKAAEPEKPAEVTEPEGNPWMGQVADDTTQDETVVQHRENAIEAAVNDERVQLEDGRTGEHTKRLEPNDCLRERARIRAQEAADTWSHDRPNGEKYYTAKDCPTADRHAVRIHMGENLARRLPDGEIVQAWMTSPMHKTVMLDEDFTQVGVARVGDYVAMELSN